MGCVCIVMLILVYFKCIGGACLHQVNGLQSRIKSMTRQMMAKVSELSMHQANALRLQQEIRNREESLKLGYENMEKGLPPSAEIEHDWQRQKQVEEQRAHDREASRLVSNTVGGICSSGMAVTIIVLNITTICCFFCVKIPIQMLLVTPKFKSCSLSFEEIKAQLIELYLSGIIFQLMWYLYTFS